MHVDLDRSAMILIGASEYPKAPTLNDGGSSFGLAMNRILNELVPLVSVEKYLLNLFDSVDGASDQYEKIDSFLIEISKEVSIKNLFLIYIGHGGIGEIDQSYFLTIRNTRDSHQQESSLQARTIANLLRIKGRNLRKYLFLDSCFSASAASAFMGTEQRVVKEKLVEINWNGHTQVKTGTAILCAAGKHKAAKYLENGTMFSESLLLAIKKGDSNREKYLTFEDLYEIINFNIIELNPRNFVIPEMHIPDQKLGMIHKINILPNFGNKSTKIIDDLYCEKKLDDGIKNVTDNITQIKRLKILAIVLSIILAFFSVQFMLNYIDDSKQQTIKTMFNLKIINPELVSILSIRNLNGEDFYSSYSKGEPLPMGKYKIELKSYRLNFPIQIQEFEIANTDVTVEIRLKVNPSKPSFKLEVNTSPKEATIKIMNIKEKYFPGIYLPNGNYRLEVSYPSYKSKTVYVDIDGKNEYPVVNLEKRY